MELVLDTNILLSGLLKPSTTQKILLANTLTFFAPEFSLIEIEKHSEEFAKRMGKNRKEFETALLLLLSNVKIIPKEEYKQFEKKAQALCPEKHKDDWPFIALALKLDCSLWSNDTALKGQVAVKVLSTKELIEELK